MKRTKSSFSLLLNTSSLLQISIDIGPFINSQSFIYRKHIFSVGSASVYYATKKTELVNLPKRHSISALFFQNIFTSFPDRYFLMNAQIYYIQKRLERRTVTSRKESGSSICRSQIYIRTPKDKYGWAKYSSLSIQYSPGNK